MKLRLLPSNIYSPAKYQTLTSFLIDDTIAIDSGSLGFALSPVNLKRVRNVVLTHTHMDHIASLPVFISESFYLLQEPICIFATSDSIQSLRENIFNDRIWPDFEKIRLSNGNGNGIRFVEIEPEKPFMIMEYRFTAVRTNHTIPTIGLAIEKETAGVVLTSDTYVTEEVWHLANSMDLLQAVFVDVSFPNEMALLAESSKHLTPEKLDEDLRKLNRNVPVFAVHLKPDFAPQIMHQLKVLGRSNLFIGEIDRDYTFPAPESV